MGLQIRKIAAETFKFVDTGSAYTFVAKGTSLLAQPATLTVQNTESNRSYPLAEIAIHDDTSTGVAETFITMDLLVLRLGVLGYKWL